MKKIDYNDGKRSALRLAVMYLLFGLLWIVFSDNLLLFGLKYLGRADQYNAFQTYKGWMFILVTAMGLFYFVNQYYEELSKSEDTLKESQKQYRLAIDGANDGIWDWNMENGYLMFSRTKRMLGYEETDLENTVEGFMKLIHPEDINSFKRTVDEYLDSKGDVWECEFRLKKKDGNLIHILSRGKAYFDEQGNPLRFSGSHTDITRIKNSEEDIYRLAYFDELTGLPNKTMFKLELQKKMNSHRSGVGFSLIYMDIDNFKNINDSMGHEIGDLLLIEISNHMRQSVSESMFVARLGGDEFGILLEGSKDEHLGWAKAVLKRFEEGWVARGRHYRLTASMGMVTYPEDGKDYVILMKYADIAMYGAKRDGGNKLRFFAKDMFEQFLEKIDLEKELREAVDKKEFVVYYQPKYSANSFVIKGFEALIRWNHKTEGLVGPGRFIPLAEETGLIIPIGKQVIEKVLDFSEKLHDETAKWHDISINVSAVQFNHLDFLADLYELLDAWRGPLDKLELELTESILLQNRSDVKEKIASLKNRGIKISLDDFGTGYSALGYLHSFNIDILKIDRSFLTEICYSEREHNIVKAIIEMAHAIGLEVVAEGVERDMQASILKELGCDQIQGFLFCHPIKEDDVIELIKMGGIKE